MQVSLFKHLPPQGYVLLQQGLENLFAPESRLKSKKIYPLRDPMMVASLLFKYSTLLARAEMYFWRVMTTPQGTGAPINLCPLTLTLPIGFLKVTMGARFTNGICNCKRCLNYFITSSCSSSQAAQIKLAASRLLPAALQGYATCQQSIDGQRQI